MSFESFDAFIHMGGHGFYVWLCYGVGLFIFFIALLAPLLTKKRILKELSQLHRRQQRNVGLNTNSNENSTEIT